MPGTKKLTLCSLVAAAVFASPAIAATIPASSGIAPFGGLVVDAYGLNGQRLLSHTAASELNKGTARGMPNTNDFLIGQQDGFKAGLMGQLGGGFASVSIRVTVFDADTDQGNFDFDDNFLRVNGVIFGNFSDVVTTTTDAQGNILNGVNDGVGFGGGETDTGTFTLTNSNLLARLFTSLEQTGSLIFEVDKRDNNGNFYDFTSASRIPQGGLGPGPALAPVPLPAGIWLLLAGLGGIGLLRRRKTV